MTPCLFVCSFGGPVVGCSWSSVCSFGRLFVCLVDDVFCFCPFVCLIARVLLCVFVGLLVCLFGCLFVSLFGCLMVCLFLRFHYGLFECLLVCFLVWMLVCLPSYVRVRSLIPSIVWLSSCV